jgi:hypothetical protein
MMRVDETMILTEDPLRTRNVPYLEELLRISAGYKYVEAVQTPPFWSSTAVPTNSDENTLNKKLEGGRIVRYRYEVSDIEKQYQSLR